MNMVTDEPTVEADVTQFMLREYDVLSDLRRDLLKIQESRIAVYLTVVAASVTAIGLSAPIQKEFGVDLFAVFPFLSSMLALCILMLGIITFVRMVERSIETVVAIRGMNRIRLFFVQRWPALREYVILANYGPNTPAFWQMGLLESRAAVLIGLPQIIAILNSFILAVVVRVVGRQPTLWTSIIGATIFAASMVFHNWWFWRRLRKMQVGYEIKEAEER